MNQDATRPLVTRDVEPAAPRELMDTAPRASVAFSDGAIADALQARAYFRPDTWRFGVVAEDAPQAALSRRRRDLRGPAAAPGMRSPQRRPDYSLAPLQPCFCAF